jgi:5-oxoprolinase (ATP-hydrolysing) subunit A
MQMLFQLSYRPSGPSDSSPIFRAVPSWAMSIDLNADVGEGQGQWRMGDDAALLSLVTSANVACGAHAGDPLVMDRTVVLARDLGVAVGAHPGYPDRDGFGRRDLAMSLDELRATVLAQVGALAAICMGRGVELRHVKLHGALYTRAAVDHRLAECVVGAVRTFSSQLTIVALAGSALLDVGRAAGLAVAAEAFADRAYAADGTLRSRSLPGALLGEPADVATQAVSIARDGRVRADDGSWLAIAADTLCLHGDTPGAVANARAVRRAFEAAGLAIASLPSARSSASRARSRSPGHHASLPSG